MDATWKRIVWQQFGAAIDMLDNAVCACPDEVWDGPTRFGHTAYHALFFLDLYLSGSLEGFAPPPPFRLSELDARGIPQGPPHTKEELGQYVAHCRAECRAAIESLTDEAAERPCRFPWLEISFGELFLYNLRHVQHHAGQLNLILSQSSIAAPRWVFRAKGAGA